MHPVPDSALSEDAVIEGLVAQLSEAVADPADGNVAGLQLRLEEAGHDVNAGVSVSIVYVNV